MYRPGRENTNADALSRHPLLPAPVVGVAEDEVQVSRVSAYRGDVDYGEVPAQLPVSVLMADSRSHPLNSSVQEGGTHVEPLIPDSLGMEKEIEAVTLLPCAEERATAATEDSVPVTTPTNVTTIPVSGGKASGDSPSLVGDARSDPGTDIGTLLHGSGPSSTPNVPGDFAVEQKDSEVKEISEYIESGRVPEDIHRARRLVSERSMFTVVDGILYFVYPRRRDRKRAVVPKQLRRLILEEAHSSRFAGHFSGQRLYASLLLHWWWRGMSQDVVNFTRSCPDCAVAMGTGRRSKPPLSRYPCPSPSKS